MTTSVGKAAGLIAFLVSSTDPAVSPLVDELFRDLPVADIEPSRVEVLPKGDAGYRLDYPQHSEPHPTLASTLAGLVTILNRKTLDADPARLHLHGGAVSRDGDGVLVIAPSGGGKTTTVTALIRNGWEYLSDEMIAIDSGADSISCWPKPLSVKSSGMSRFESLTPGALPPGYLIDHGLHVPASRLGASIMTTATPRLIVLLDPDSSAETIEQIPPGEAVIELVHQSMDMDRFGEGGLGALARLCSSCRCVRIRRSEPPELARLIETEFEKAVIENRPAPGDAAERSFPSLHITIVDVDKGMVVRNSETGAIAVLNADGAEVLLRTIENQYDACQGDYEFQQDLIRAGLLSGATKSRP